jgi:WD40-like Beta Propeller Repeat
MTISNLKTLGAAALACALALGGAHTLTLGQSAGLGERQEPAAAVPDGDHSYTALSRSVNKLESELDETARRSAEMRKELQIIRTKLQSLSGEPRSGAASEAATQFASVLGPHPAQAVARLVEQLKRHPVQPKAAPDRVGLYLIDLRNGEVTLIADQPAPGLTRCGSAAWSHDGRRILYDATPGTQWSLTRLQSIALGDDRPTVTELGSGNCPTFSPADDRIFFLSNADSTESGVWLMKSDGSDRRRFGDYGKPIWSPDGHQLMIMSFETPRQVTLMDAAPEKSGVLQLSGHEIYAHPSWAGKETIVAGIGPTESDTIALIDVSDPHQAKVKEVLWQRANGPDVEPAYPIYSATTGRCIFVGKGAKGMVLYSVQHNQAGPAKPLVLQEQHPWIADLASSPDGRYILYSAQGPGEAQGNLTP